MSENLKKDILNASGGSKRVPVSTKTPKSGKPRIVIYHLDESKSIVLPSKTPPKKKEKDT